MKFLEKNFKRILKEKGLKQAQVAERIGRDLGGLNKTVKSNKDFKWSSIQEIAKALEVEPWELVIDEEAGETGPLSQEEKALVLEYRRLAAENKPLLQLAAKAMK